MPPISLSLSPEKVDGLARSKSSAGELQYSNYIHFIATNIIGIKIITAIRKQKNSISKVLWIDQQTILITVSGFVRFLFRRQYECCNNRG